MSDEKTELEEALRKSLIDNARQTIKMNMILLYDLNPNAKNYLIDTLIHEEGFGMEVIIQRTEGITVAERLFQFEEAARGIINGSIEDPAKAMREIMAHLIDDESNSKE